MLKYIRRFIRKLLYPFNKYLMGIRQKLVIKKHINSKFSKLDNILLRFLNKLLDYIDDYYLYGAELNRIEKDLKI